MGKIKRLIRNVLLLTVFYIFFGALTVVIIVDDARKPVVYVSVPTGKIVQVEINGKKVPLEAIDGRRRYHRVWVGPEWGK